MRLSLDQRWIALWFTALCISIRLGFNCLGQDASLTKQLPVPFVLSQLSAAPSEYPTDIVKGEKVRGIFYEGVPYKGKPTRVFAYYGVPKQAAENPKAKFPAMVLIHGGGGSAFDRWVRLWNDRGYVAIAMDLCGCVPVGSYGKWERHEFAGPMGWQSSFEQLDTPVQDQWTWHAVSAVALAHSLIRTYPEVDGDRIGVTGISWGGYLTSIVAGVDSRFKLAVPVYGCGFLGDNSAWLPQFESLGPRKAKMWLDQWDPSGYLPHANMPMLWVNGTNDFAYPMDSWQKSYRLPKAASSLCLRIRMPHGHGNAGENPEEIHVFANSLLRGETPLPSVIEHGFTVGQVWAKFYSAVPIERAELSYTCDRGKWQDRKWEALPAEVDRTAMKVQSIVPADATAFYLNLFDQRGCAVSTPHIVR
jgi:dienelactone hydrolase